MDSGASQDLRHTPATKGPRSRGQERTGRRSVGRSSAAQSAGRDRAGAGRSADRVIPRTLQNVKAQMPHSIDVLADLTADGAPVWKPCPACAVLLSPCCDLCDGNGWVQELPDEPQGR